MSTEENNDVAQAKAALAKLKTSQAPRKSALKALVMEIAEDVQERMREGYTLSQIVGQLNKTRNENDQIHEATFRGYLQDARKELGLGPVRKKTAKTSKTDRRPAKRVPKSVEPVQKSTAPEVKDEDQSAQPKIDKELNAKTTFKNQERDV